jgi:hypothetical protein
MATRFEVTMTWLKLKARVWGIQGSWQDGMLNLNTSINKVNYSKEDDQFTQNKAHDHEK